MHPNSIPLPTASTTIKIDPSCIDVPGSAPTKLRLVEAERDQLTTTSTNCAIEQETSKVGAAALSSVGPFSSAAPIQAGEGGKAGKIIPPLSSFAGLKPTNSEFVAAIFNELPEGATAVVTAKAGDPEQGGWQARSGSQVDSICRSELNTYFNCASFAWDDISQPAARKDKAAAYHALVLDDVGTKVDQALLRTIKATWKLETSPGNFQIGFKLSPPLIEPEEVHQLQKHIAAAGLTDKGALGMVRWVRLPDGVNGKAKHSRDGKPFACNLHAWNPGNAFSAAELIEALAPRQSVTAQIDTKERGKSARATMKRGSTGQSAVYLPRAVENPVLTAFRTKGLYKRQIEPGKHEVTCPWVIEHTDALDSGTAYFEPDAGHPNGGFCCQHSHKDQYHLQQVIEHFDLDASAARNRSIIRTVQGEMHEVVAAAEAVLAEQADVFQAGRLLVKAAYDQAMGDWGIKPLSEAEITLMLSRGSDWEKYDKRAKAWERCDPSPRHVATLYKAERYDVLRQVIGLARQPYYRATGQGLVTEAGYDPVAQRLSVFDAARFPVVGSTEAEAREALAFIDELLSEFHFAKPEDKAAALSAILTAAVRPSLDLAPAFHVKAPASGSGKSFLCEVIAGFAGPGRPARMSYPKTSDEATKSIMAALLASPAVIEFDDMDTDWIPHGSINRMLTSLTITDRILGLSKTATVSTNALILGSGNNVGPIRDLNRRVVTVNLDTRSATPGTIKYNGNPVATLKANRERYVMAALTIIEAWRAAGSPSTDVPALASYGGAWADHCRHPLIWLGLPDPAANLIQQMQNDPDAEHMKAFFSEWYRKHGDATITVRRLLEDAYEDDLQDALSELPIIEHGKVNRSKLGWFLKRNVNRIVGGYVLEQVPTPERVAWKVVKLEAEATGLPASPPLTATNEAIVTAEHAF